MMTESPATEATPDLRAGEALAVAAASLAPAPSPDDEAKRHTQVAHLLHLLQEAREVADAIEGAERATNDVLDNLDDQLAHAIAQLIFHHPPCVLRALIAG